MKNKMIAVLSAIIFLALVVDQVSADLIGNPIIEDFEGAIGPFESYYDESTDVIGSTFLLGGSGVVTALGVYAPQGLNSPHQVALWQTSNQTAFGEPMVASAVVGTDGIAAGDFLYAQLASPVPLVAGQNYVLGMEIASGDGDVYFASPSSVTLHEMISNFNEVFPASPNSGFGIPTGVSTNFGAIGPNMLIVIPEPSCILIIWSGLICFQLKRRVDVA